MFIYCLFCVYCIYFFISCPSCVCLFSFVITNVILLVIESNKISLWILLPLIALSNDQLTNYSPLLGQELCYSIFIMYQEWSLCLYVYINWFKFWYKHIHVKSITVQLQYALTTTEVCSFFFNLCAISLVNEMFRVCLCCK